MITVKQKLILFHIACEPGMKDIHRMIIVYDRADFPSHIGENLKELLEQKLIYVTKRIEPGGPIAYGVTIAGLNYLDDFFDEEEIISYIKTLQNPHFLLELTQIAFDKRKE